MKLVILLALIAQLSFSNALPSYLLKLDENYSKHVFVVEKSTHKLFVYTFDNGNIELTKTYSIASGKITGNKSVAGDKKTPEGIYFLNTFYSQNSLYEKYGDAALIYGAGAFTIDYPNRFDQLNSKTGGGIWLHSTDDDSRVSKGLDSRGCVVATDKDIRDISKYISLKRTPIIISDNISIYSDEAYDVNKKDLENFFISWSNAWRNKSFKMYISHYSKNLFQDKSKGNYDSFKQYKSHIFKKLDRPEIEFSDVSILRFKDTAVISATQEYKSNSINDIGRKRLYLKQNNRYEWKIIKEDWKKISPKLPKNYFSKVN